MSRAPKKLSTKNLNIRFGERVAIARDMKGMRQADLAHAIGLTRTSVVNIERGRQRVLLETAVLIAKALGVSLNALTKGLAEETKP